MAHPDGRYNAIPNHRQLKVNTLRTILKQCGLSETRYLELYAGKRI